MTIEAKIILYSSEWTNQQFSELTTFQLKYPRFIHCFDDKTEVLVKEKGGYPYFAKFSEVVKNPNVLVAQIHEDDLSVEFVDPIAWIEKEYDGQMVEIFYERLSMMVTPEHRLLVDSRKSKYWKRETIQAGNLLLDHTAKKINKCGSLSENQRSQTIDLHLAKLIAFFVSDGHTPREGLRSNFHFKKERKISEVKNLLNQCGIEFTENFNSDETTTIWFKTQPWMLECYNEMRAKKLPNFLWSMSKESYESFKRGLFESDGNVENEEYNNSSEVLIDQIQVLAHLNNDSFNKRIYDGIWKVSFQTEKTPTIRKDKSSSAKGVPYQGKVYCVSVPSTFVMVRRDGIVHISGNCELMTHRVFSRNASSSRAIPVKKMIQDIKDDPAMPIYWGKNQAGMQARAELTDEEITKCKSLWLEQRDETIHRVEKLMEIGLHKQTANRLLEPWAHIHVILSATELDNWFALRSHPDAQPEIKNLSDKMRVVLDEIRSKDRQMARRLKAKEPVWHLPYIKKEEYSQFKLVDLIKMSVARCARVSYMNHDGTNPDPEKDFELHDKLVVSKPQHMSPAEHQAVFANPDQFYGNFRGWKQYRKFIEEGLTL